MLLHVWSLCRTMGSYDGVLRPRSTCVYLAQEAGKVVTEGLLPTSVGAWAMSVESERSYFAQQRIETSRDCYIDI